MTTDDWFLTVAERGNPATRIDEHQSGEAWTEGNHVELLVDGAEYFPCLFQVLTSTTRGDTIMFTGLEGNADEYLVPGAVGEIGQVLAHAAARGVAVRGLVWRSHALVYSEVENLMFSRLVNEAGGEVLLDQRVLPRGSHHQKIVIVRRRDRAEDDVAFVGGMDLAHGRRDGVAHRGDPQAADLARANYGATPPWHDVQAAIRGPAVDDIARTFRERWEDPTPLDHRNPVRAVLHRAARHPSSPSALPPERSEPPQTGTCAVQVLRTYPARKPPYPFAPEGERSIARAYIKAFRHASCLVYLEDQYLWSSRAADELCAALRREPELKVVIVIPRHPDPDGRIAGNASALGRRAVQDALAAAGGDRVAVYDLENAWGTPVYVHSKVCIVDDVWLAVGSDNLNRRSWTHDSEVSCAVLDERRDERAPTAIGADTARFLARDTRLRLVCEHTGTAPERADELVEPTAWFDELGRCADALDAWHAGGQLGPRPPGHLRRHPVEDPGPVARHLLRWVHANVLDPDGRPASLRASDEY